MFISYRYPVGFSVTGYHGDSQSCDDIITFAKRSQCREHGHIYVANNKILEFVDDLTDVLTDGQIEYDDTLECLLTILDNIYKDPNND